MENQHAVPDPHAEKPAAKGSLSDGKTNTTNGAGIDRIAV
jgi:hypothetical protein